MDLNNILIGSEKPEALVEFYTKVLGAPIFSDAGYTAWQIGTGYVAVGPHSEVKGKNTTPGRLIWNITTKLLDLSLPHLTSNDERPTAHPTSSARAFPRTAPRHCVTHRTGYPSAPCGPIGHGKISSSAP